MTLDNMKPERDATEEFFEYDAEEFLVFLTLLITEGRTPEYSVKGRTEGLHCPPAQSAMPPLHKHECSDKLPQCRQARRTRSEVILLWRNSIPIMIEVMLLPDCCYGDECPPSDLISDPVIKQDALLLERWTLQPVPRQSGDRFIEEKTLLLAVRSYVFFSQLSAWLSASHGIVPRNILYRISAADEELVWKFSQPPSEHIFPVPNVSQSVALQVRVQSLPRQPTYPTLACSIHTGLPPLYSKTPSLSPNFNSHGGLPTLKKSQDPSKDNHLNSSANAFSKNSNSMSSLFLNGLPIPNLPINNIPINSFPHSGVPHPYSKKGQEPNETHAYQNGELPQVSIPQRQGSPLFHRSSQSPTPSRSHSPSPSPLPTSKSATWLYSTHNGSPDPAPVDDYGSSTNSSERSKAPIPEPLKALKNFSLADQPRCPSPRPAATETNPLIGSLLQERQEVIARIAQRLNFCDPSAPPLPPSLFAPDNPPKAMWGSNHDDVTATKTKEPDVPPYESVGRVWPTPFNTPVTDSSFGKWEPSSSKPTTCRKLKMTEMREREEERNGEREKDKEKWRDGEKERDSSLIAQAVQDITRLIQERLSVPSLSPRHSRSGSPLHHTHTTTVTHTVRTYSHTTHIPQASHTATNGYANGHTPSQEPHRGSMHTAANHAPICTDKPQVDPGAECHSPRAQNGAQFTLEETLLRGQYQAQDGQRLRTPPQEKLRVGTPSSHDTPPASPILESVSRNSQIFSWTCDHASPTMNCNRSHDRSKPQPLSQMQNCAPSQASAPQDENQAPSDSGGTSSPEMTPPPAVLRAHSPSPLRPCNSWKKQNRHSLDATATKAFHPCTGLPLLSSPVPQRRNQTGFFDLDTSLSACKGLPWASGKRVCPKREGYTDESQQLFSASAPPASLSLLGNFEECVLNYRLDPLGTVEGFTAEVGASGSFCPSHLTLPVDVSFYSVSDDNAPSPYMGVINLETLGKRGYRVPPSGTIQVTLFNPNKTVVKMFVVMYDLRAMPAGHQTFVRQRTFSVPVRRDTNNQTSRKPLTLGQGRTLRYLVHLRFQSSKSGKIYLHRDIRLLFSRKSMEVDSGAAYELQSFTESPVDPPFSPRC
ncbi:atos homolog protein A [Pholidichthys leucotaenia]